MSTADFGSETSATTSGRRFRVEWKNKFKWLDYSPTEDKVYCATCKTCDSMQLFSFSTKRDEAFTGVGYSNWKKAIQRFHSHESAFAHREAVMKVGHAARGTNVSSQLSSAKAKDMIHARDSLLQIASSLRYLCRQGLAVRGHTETESNFAQLLRLRGEDSESMNAWLTRTAYRWLSPAIQNELIENMAMAVQRVLQREIAECKFYSVVLDETFDISVLEQVGVCLRYVSRSLDVNESFLGFYETSSTTADILFRILQDTLVRFQLSFENCRGQCFDGAANLSGKLSGVQTKVHEIQPKALHVHCTSHSLNLAFQDALGVVAECRDAMNLAKDVINFVRDSPKRLACFSSMQECDDRHTLRPLCPTRWTMRVSSVRSLLENYDALLAFLQDTSDTTVGEVGAKASGYHTQLHKFETFFALKLVVEIFSRCEIVASKLQSKSISLAEAENLVSSLQQLMSCQRTDEKFDQFWEIVRSDAETLLLKSPKLHRNRRPSRRIDTGAVPHIHDSPKDRDRQIYFSSLDACLTALRTRFQSEGFIIARTVEQVLIQATRGCTVDLAPVINHFGTDINPDRLSLHLSMLGDLCASLDDSEKPSSMSTLVELLRNKVAWRDMLPEVTNVLTLFLCLPVTTCTAERSFSSLRRLKTYLRSTMTQKRLNHIAFLHCHKDLTDGLDLTVVINDFISVNDFRKKTFAVFPHT